MTGLVWFTAGVIMGLLHALMMSASVRRLDASVPKRSVLRLLAGTALRWACVAALLTLALHHTGTSGLLAVGGLWFARWVAIAWWQRQRDERIGRLIWKR